MGNVLSSSSFFLISIISVGSLVFTVTVPLSQGFRSTVPTLVLLVNAAVGTYAWAKLIYDGMPLTTLAPAMSLLLPILGVAVGYFQGEPLPAPKLMWLGAGGVCLMMANR